MIPASVHLVDRQLKTMPVISMVPSPTTLTQAAKSDSFLTHWPNDLITFGNLTISRLALAPVFGSGTAANTVRQVPKTYNLSCYHALTKLFRFVGQALAVILQSWKEEAATGHEPEQGMTVVWKERHGNSGQK